VFLVTKMLTTGHSFWEIRQKTFRVGLSIPDIFCRIFNNSSF